MVVWLVGLLQRCRLFAQGQGRLNLSRLVACGRGIRSDLLESVDDAVHQRLCGKELLLLQVALGDTNKKKEEVAIYVKVDHWQIVTGKHKGKAPAKLDAKMDKSWDDDLPSSGDMDTYEDSTSSTDNLTIPSYSDEDIPEDVSFTDQDVSLSQTHELETSEKSHLTLVFMV
ncbi:hypothetical protein TRIUR3_27773 [Triticum urartu]|uniref:Uncharacterized protein n=1 Tax=Triticum urartu TaxID=4572 RepID=M7Z6R9_TRIUA|nr:hypothetical protein TRIUR3_27773 [Triticum urartu]